jgi:triosephosphate isomerase
MPRKKLIAANWKMHKSIADAASFAEGLRQAAADLPDCDLAIFPPFFAVSATARVLEGTDIHVGAQDLFWERQGAFTGEVSAEMIADAGGTHVLVGHSERRNVIGEDNAVVARKLSAAVDARLTAIFCVGERLDDREAGRAEAYVDEQITTGLTDFDKAKLGRVVVAYEPVWAIGTGKTATPDDAEAMHAFIRTAIAKRFGEEAASSMRILYGGSVKPENAADLLDRSEIDGALIGGAALELDSYLAIARSVR